MASVFPTARPLGYLNHYEFYLRIKKKKGTIHKYKKKGNTTFISNNTIHIATINKVYKMTISS